jgi:formate-dependent nitrite reductase membrane component NrfD
MQRILRQGELSFAVGYKRQTRWGRMEALVFTLECAGAGLLAAALVLGAPPLMLAIGVALVAAAVVLLLAHLGHPTRAWRAVRAVRTAWISRGTLVLGTLVGLGALYVLALHFGGVDPAAGAARAARLLLLACACFVTLYPGLVLAASPAIPFWNSALLPVLSAASGAASGLALLVALGARTDAAAWGLVVALAALAACVALHLITMRARGAAAAESVALLLRDHAAAFLGLACAVGIAFPALAAYLLATGSGGAALAVAAAAARLAGDLALRDLLLKVGLYEPLV